MYFLSLAVSFLLCVSLTLSSKVYAQDNPEAPLSGKGLFIKNRCANCHTIGRGRFVGPDLSGVGGRYTKDEIKQWMENPQVIYQSKGKMPVNEGYPPMPPLSVPPNEAEAVADYLLTFKPSAVLKAESGVIEGKVVNKSTGDVAGNIEVTLTAYLGDRPTGEKKTKTDGEGFFNFKDLAWDRSYAISLNHKGAEYVTDRLVFYPEEDRKTLDLPIYEPTDSDKGITVNAGHMIVQVSGEEIAVAEILVFHNGSEEVYVGKEIQNGVRETLRFDLPEGAGNIQFLDGLRSEGVIQTAQGFIDTSAFGPGIKRVVYAYTLPYESGKSTFEKRLNYPTEGFILLVSDSGVKVKVDGLKGGDAVSINNDQFLQWTGAGLKPGTEVKIELGKPYLGGGALKWAAFGVAVVLVGGGVLYSLFVKKTEKKVVGDNAYTTNDLEREREDLIREIAKLDDSFEAKEISESEYRETRSKKKERLIEVTRKFKNG